MDREKPAIFETSRHRLNVEFGKIRYPRGKQKNKIYFGYFVRLGYIILNIRHKR